MTGSFYHFAMPSHNVILISVTLLQSLEQKEFIIFFKQFYAHYHVFIKSNVVPLISFFSIYA